MTSIPTPSQKAASALRRAEKALRNWQDDPDSPRSDVDKMLAIIEDLRSWVQGHVLSEIERQHNLHPPTPIAPPDNDDDSHNRRRDEN